MTSCSYFNYYLNISNEASIIKVGPEQQLYKNESTHLPNLINYWIFLLEVFVVPLGVRIELKIFTSISPG